MPKGLFLDISDELNTAFHAEIEHRKGRKLRRGDVASAGEEAIKLWLSSRIPKWPLQVPRYGPKGLPEP
jgi:hypothetical protein